MYKLDLEKSEEPEIKSSTLIHSSKKQESSRKNICFIDYTKTFDCVDHNKLWKILEKVRISDHLTYLLRNLYAGQEATVRTKHGKTDWFKIGKVVCQPCLLLLLLLSRFSRVRLCATPWAAAYQSSLSMGFSRQEHWSGLPFPSSGDLPSPGKEPVFLTSPALLGVFFTTSATGEAQCSY